MTIAIAAEPVSIPLSSQDARQQQANEERLAYFTGKTVAQIKALADTQGLPLRRTGTGRGTRYELFLADYRRWISDLPRD